MKKIKEIGISNFIICIIVIGYTLLCILSVSIAFINNSFYIDSINNLDDAIKTFDDYGQRGKTYYRPIDNNYTEFVTGTIPSTRVIFGKDNWLFYKGEITSIQDFEGTNDYSESEMKQMLDACLDVQNELEKRNIKFALLVPPNKERVYYEYMPDNYKHNSYSRTDKLVDYLSNNGVNAISPLSEFLEAKNEYGLYYKYDTHWNQLGAYIGTKCVLDLWDIDIPSLNSRIINKKPLYNNYHECAMDDLAGMIGMKYKYNDDIEYSISENIEIDFDNINHIENSDATYKETLLLIGDSFRVSMIPTLATHFSNVCVVHWNEYNKELIDSIKPEYVIAEHVERYSNGIKNIETLIN